MYTVLVIVHVLVAVCLITLVLIQHGKGADAGAAFGSGASGTVFGARGSANFLTKTTAWLAAAFFIVSLALAYLVHGRSGGSSIVDQLQAAPPAAEAAKPVAPPPAATTPAVPDAAPATAGKPDDKKPETPKVPD